MRPVPALLLAAMLLSGCASDSPGPSLDEADKPAPAAPELAGNTTLPILANASEAPTYANLTEFHWGLMEDVESFALQLTVDFGGENECEMRDGTVHGPGPLGPHDLTLYERDGSAGWGTSSSGSLASAHAGPVDTRSESSGSGGSRSASLGTMSGVLQITYMGRDLVAGDDFTGGAAFSFSILCDRPFAITQALGGSQLLLANNANLAGGAGAEAPDASANVQDGAAAEFMSPVVRAAADGFGAQAARVAVSHPGGSEEWTWLPDYPLGLAGFGSFQSLTGGPGAYSFTVDRAAAEFEAFWLAAWGLDGAVDLEANRLDEALWESPF